MYVPVIPNIDSDSFKFIAYKTVQSELNQLKSKMKSKQTFAAQGFNLSR